MAFPGGLVIGWNSGWGVERVKRWGFPSWWGTKILGQCLVQPKKKRKFKFQMGAFLKCESMKR